MGWGIVANINKTNLDNDADDPSLAREDLYAALGELENTINGRNAADGVAGLDSSQKIPAALLPNTIVSDVSQNLILAPDTGRVAIQDILYLTPKTTAELEALSALDGDVAVCSDGDSGAPCLAVYSTSNDGSTVGWNRISFGDIISSS